MAFAIRRQTPPPLESTRSIPQLESMCNQTCFSVDTFNFLYMMMMMMTMTMMTNIIPYWRTRIHIWEKVLMGIWASALSTLHTIVSINHFVFTNILICICRICISYLSGSLPREKRPTCLAGGAFLVAGELSARTPLTNEIWAALPLAKYSFFWTLFL